MRSAFPLLLRGSLAPIDYNDDVDEDEDDDGDGYDDDHEDIDHYHHHEYNDGVDDDGDGYDADSHHLPIHIWFPSLNTCKMSCARQTYIWKQSWGKVEKKLEK